LNTDRPGLAFRTSYDFDPLPDRIITLFSEWERKGKLGFMLLPEDMELADKTILEAKRTAGFADRMIVCGIGGSSLGLKALLSAFSLNRGDKCRVTVLDSPDSSQIRDAICHMDPDRTAVTVITKSGGTAETLSVFLSIYDWISRSVNGEKAIIALTDPVHGDLRRLVTDRNWSSLPIPPSVGGRFSVLSPAGLFPAAFAGIDIKALLIGAKTVLDDFRKNGTDSLASKIAAGFLGKISSRAIHVFFSYEDKLFDTALWFAQLWAESLGKNKDLAGRPTMTGQTPLACRGPADQHSLVQLFVEGPADKTATIVTVNPGSELLKIPAGFEDYPSLSYLEGLAPDDLREAEATATGKALEETGMPVSYLELRELGERSLGELLMCLEIATVLVGLALDINPLDQPGVERGKILAYAALNRPGY
jgi:glucose-6-phosphate isomerase